MRFITIKIILCSFLVLLNFSFSQDECEDVGAFGFGCDQIINSFGFTCDQNFSGNIVGDICPVSCDTCPDEGGEGITDGCDLPENTLYLTEDGSILYNSTDDIGGFQFTIDGTPTAASGGDAASAGFTISVGGTTVLAFSFTGAVVPAGCGTLVEVEGDINGVEDWIISDAVGGPLEFSYYGDEDTGETEGCTDNEACNYNTDATLDDGSC